jgi:hypothetical protein
MRLLMLRKIGLIILELIRKILELKFIKEFMKLFLKGMVIVPSSLTGSPYMINNYQHAMTICRAYKNPNLFITFTYNANWLEIRKELCKERSYKQEDKLDTVTQIFHAKLSNMLSYIKQGKPFGCTIAGIAKCLFLN